MINFWIAFLSIALSGTYLLIYGAWRLCKKSEVEVTPEEMEAIKNMEKGG